MQVLVQSNFNVEFGFKRLKEKMAKLYYDDANLSNLSEKTIAEIRYGNQGILHSIRKLYFLSERNDPQTPRYMTESKARRGKVANGPVEQTEL